jgi:hypothetical protein
MNHQYEEAKLSSDEIQEIYRNMEAKRLTHIYCQACSEEMKPEQARKSPTGPIMCRLLWRMQRRVASAEFRLASPQIPRAGARGASLSYGQRVLRFFRGL